MADTQNNGQGLVASWQITPGLITPRMLAATPTIAAGDTYYSDGKKFIRLTAGTTKQVLTITNGIPAWSSLSSIDSWHTPTLLNSWVNFGSNWQVAGYTKDALGIVHLRGLIKSGTVGSAAFQLPTGYIPSKDLMFAIVSNDTIGEVIVDASGFVTVQVGNNAFASLSGITFDTQ